MIKLPQKPVLVAVLAVALLIVISGVFIASKVFTSSQPVPANIEKQLSIIVLYPSDNNSNRFTIDSSSWRYDKSLGLLTYVVAYQNTNITVSEQASPPELTEVPGRFDALTNKLNTYSDFDTLDGHVYLTHPTELKGGQSALMNAKGNLIFAKPDKNLSDNDWRIFFNSLDIVK